MTVAVLAFLAGLAAGARGGISWGARRALWALAREDVRKRYQVIRKG